MQKNKKISNGGYLLFSIIFVINACNSTKQSNPEPIVRDSLSVKKRLTNYNDSIYPKLTKAIQTGDIVTRLGNDLTSTMLAKINLHDKSYSHIGIASIEHDTIFIYHALGGEFNPSQKLRRETLWSFAHPNDNKKIGIFRFNFSSAEINTLQQIIQSQYKKEIPFDMDFDLATDDKLYCAEFVAKALDKTKKDNHFIKISHTPTKDFIGVDDIFLHAGAAKILEVDEQ